MRRTDKCQSNHKGNQSTLSAFRDGRGHVEPASSNENYLWHEHFVQPTLLFCYNFFSCDQLMKISPVENHKCELTFFPSDLRRESHRRSYRSLQ